MESAHDGISRSFQRLPQRAHAPLSSTLQTSGKESDDYSDFIESKPAMTAAAPMLSSSLAALFVPGVVCAELIGIGDPDSLLPAEAQFLGRAVASRREEFAAGRACVRRALYEFGILDFPLAVADDRRPIWPEGFTGSITHTQGFCAAVVARRQALRALGIDTERGASVKPELWPRICGPETAWLQALPEAQRPAAATLIFCAKEAFYKCQYALTAEYLGFNDARVDISSWGDATGNFEVRACKPIVLTQHVALPLTGRYRFHQEFVTTGVALPQ
jgi:4'-phosphopantetheinyl transferase EntD